MNELFAYGVRVQGHSVVLDVIDTLEGINLTAGRPVGCDGPERRPRRALRNKFGISKHSKHSENKEITAKLGVGEKEGQ